MTDLQTFLVVVLSIVFYTLLIKELWADRVTKKIGKKA